MTNGKSGYPVQSMKVRLLDGSYHSVDSDGYSFELAAKIAYREILDSVMPYLIEPIMSSNIYSPEEHIGSVISDFSKRGGIVSEVSNKDGLKHVIGNVPASKMFGYMTELRTMTSGRGDYNMVFSHYAKS